MIDKKFIDYLAGKSGIKDKSLIEKDFILQSLLIGFSKDKYFVENFAFKGGTCLVKCYAGYFRFSEDLDFTYINQGIFEGKNEKEIRRFLSSEISKLIGIVAYVSKIHGLDFKAEKVNKRYIEFGGSNKFLTLKIWFVSSVNKREQFIKIQINFVELFDYKFKKLAAKPLITKFDIKELKFLFPEYSDVLLMKPRLIVYDIKEILLEKVRAILMRREVKAKDFIDVFVITKILGKEVKSFKIKIISKIQFMLRYEKYKQNLEEKINIKTWIKPGEEQQLLLKSQDGFQIYLKKLQPFLKDILSEFSKK